MGYSQADKVATHQRIVETAAKRFREVGVDGISIADIMKEAGLTVGGFYKHFESRDELVAEALSVALRDIEPWELLIRNNPRKAIRSYMSEAHRDDLSTSCALSALAGDVSRSTEAARDIYTARTERVLDLFAKALPPAETGDNRAAAMLVFSACVGALTLSRVVSDKKLSRQLLDGVTAELQALFPAKKPA